MIPSDIQKLVERRLRMFAAFSGVRIILQREGDIATRVETALRTAGGEFRPGTALVIGTASSSLRQIQAARLVIDPLGVTVKAVEQEIFNKPPAGSGKRAGDLAVEAAAALAAWTPAGCGRPLSPSAGDSNIREASDGEGRAVASFTMDTSLELPVLRLPGEHGYNAPNINQTEGNNP